VAKGLPPRILNEGNPYAINKVYNPGLEQPPQPEKYYYTPRDIAHDLVGLRMKMGAGKMAATLGLGGRTKKKSAVPVNIILFVPEKNTSEKPNWQRSLSKFKQLASLTGGQFRTIKGLKAIESAAYAAQDARDEKK
jgi:hypothetical protein